MVEPKVKTVVEVGPTAVVATIILPNFISHSIGAPPALVADIEITLLTSFEDGARSVSLPSAELIKPVSGMGWP